jgi:hypothetical protein
MMDALTDERYIVITKLTLCTLCSGELKQAITPKLGKAELQFLCTAYLPNEIYIPAKFHVDTFVLLDLCNRQVKGTDI